jgi:hypothetical protein
MRRLTILLFAGRILAQLPEPAVIDPGSSDKAPSDAIVLFNGSALTEWRHTDGNPAKWLLDSGHLVCKSGTGDLITRREFGSAQIHLEFNVPDMPTQSGQRKGNSGLFIQGRYEIQILDSYRNPTYAAGSAGAIYGQSVPLVNVSRPPGQWQSYDVLYRAPECGEDGQVVRAPIVTVLHNGVLIQDAVRLTGPTPGGDSNVCRPGPILLQDHYIKEVGDTPVRFRNIWVRPLPEPVKEPTRDRRPAPR